MSIPPVALYSLSAAVEESGFPCTILDPIEYWRLYREPAQFLQIVQLHDVFCISANSHTWTTARLLIAMVAKVQPRPVIILGGLHSSYCDEHVMQTTPVDVVVRGEGEFALPEVLRCLAGRSALDAVAGVTFRRNGVVFRTPDRKPLTNVELTQVPLPLWERLPRNVYGFIPLEVSRGCRYGCTFCSIYFKHYWRSFQLEGMRRRIEHAAASMARVRYRTILFSDDCFTTDSELVTSVARVLRSVDSAIGVGIEARACDLLKREIQDALGQLNVEFIQIGVECGYADGLQRIRKGVTLSDVIESAHALHRIGIHGAAKYSYIIGFPWENLQNIMRTLAFSMNVASLYGNRVQVNWLHIFPGSDIYYDFKREGRVAEADYDSPPTETDYFYRVHPSVSGSDMRQVHDYAIMLQQTFPWVSTGGNVFRSWRCHSHIPSDRTTPTTYNGEAMRCAIGPQAVKDNGMCPLPPFFSANMVGDV